MAPEATNRSPRAPGDARARRGARRDRRRRVFATRPRLKALGFGEIDAAGRGAGQDRRRPRPRPRDAGPGGSRRGARRCGSRRWPGRRSTPPTRSRSGLPPATQGLAGRGSAASPRAAGRRSPAPGPGAASVAAPRRQRGRPRLRPHRRRLPARCGGRTRGSRRGSKRRWGTRGASSTSAPAPAHTSRAIAR